MPNAWTMPSKGRCHGGILLAQSHSLESLSDIAYKSFHIQGLQPWALCQTKDRELLFRLGTGCFLCGFAVAYLVASYFSIFCLKTFETSQNLHQSVHHETEDAPQPINGINIKALTA